MLTRGKRLYNSAIGASIGALLEGGDYSRATYDGSEWIDLAGQYIPLGEVERMASDIASGNLSLESIKATLGRLMAEYRDMAAADAYNLLRQLMGAKPSEEEVQSIIASSKNILRQMREATEQDRQRDTGLDMMVGYGYDFRDEKEQEADFRNTR